MCPSVSASAQAHGLQENILRVVELGGGGGLAVAKKHTTHRASGWAPSDTSRGIVKLRQRGWEVFPVRQKPK
jgi:hypothetical protein